MHAFTLEASKDASRIGLVLMVIQGTVVANGRIMRVFDSGVWDIVATGAFEGIFFQVLLYYLIPSACLVLYNF